MNINLDRVVAAQELRNPENSHLHSMLYLTGFLMLSTGLSRLYTKDDFLLFFRRMAILGNHYGMIDDFFLDGRLFRCASFGREVHLRPVDFIPLIGVTFGSRSRVAVPEEKWMLGISKFIRAANLIGLFSQNVVFIRDVSLKEDKDGLSIRFNESIPALTPQQISNADILAQSMLSDIPNWVFTEWQAANPEAVVEYDRYVDEVSRIRQFDFDGMDQAQKEAVYEHFRQFFGSHDWNEVKIRKLTHLAWAFANDHVWNDQYEVGTVADYIDFDERGLEHEGGGINLFETNELYCLDDLAEILRE